MKVESGYILETLEHKEASDLDKVIDIWKLISDESRVVATYRDVHDLQTLHNVILDVDPRWANPRGRQLAVLNDKSGLWDFTYIGICISRRIPTCRPGGFIRLQNVLH
jgi:pro-apoptotic serine protease NMA111